jgi:hypothetical protein
MGNIIMSSKEREQAKVFDRLKRGEITQKIAAEILEISDRWVRTKFDRFLIDGDAGLVHKNRGNPSKKRLSKNIEAILIDLLTNQLQGAGPTFIAEKLDELKGIKLNRETLRLWMMRNGFWSKKRKRCTHRKRRDRKACFGIMIQLDGSPHDWFEGRGPKCTLLVFIDDATSRIVWLEFAKSESTEALMKATKKYMQKFGRPVSFYVDFGGVFSVNTNNPNRDKITQFERACKELGIEIIHAHSPQAKGRVERANQTLQDRLVKELRLAGISTMDEANVFVQTGYIEKHNAKFAVQATNPIDAHRSSKKFDLDKIFCMRETRMLQNDFVVVYKTRLFQLTQQQSTIIRPKNIITINEHLDGKIRLSIRKTQLHFTEIIHRQEKQVLVRELKHYKPAATHPWRSGFNTCSARTKNQMESRVKAAPPAVEANCLNPPTTTNKESQVVSMG